MSNRWEYNFSSPLDDLLKQNVSLTTLLDEDEIVPETRNHNEELLKRLQTSDVLLALAEAIVAVPKADADDKVKFRYPVVACEILSAPVDSLQLALLNEAPAMNSLLQFFNTATIDILRGNLVIKVLRSSSTWLESFTSHLDCAPVGEFLSKLANADLGVSDGEDGVADWLVSSRICELLLDQLKPEKRFHADSAQATVEILLALKWSSPVSQKMQSLSNQIVDYIVDASNPKAQRYAPRVLQTLLVVLFKCCQDEAHQQLLHTASTTPDDDASPFPFTDPSEPLAQQPELVRVCVARLGNLFSCFQDQGKNSRELTLPDQSKIKSFGPSRTAILELFTLLASLEYTCIQEALVQSVNLFDYIYNLFVAFPGNNLMHRLIERLFSTFLEQIGATRQLQFLESCKLASKLITDHKAHLEAGPKSPYKEFIPYLYSIAETLVVLGDASEAVKAHLDKISEWNDFTNFLTERRARETPVPVSLTQNQDEGFKPELEGEAVSEPNNYIEGNDNDEDDLALPDDVDLDSGNDGDDYDIDQAEILLTKQEIEAFA